MSTKTYVALQTQVLSSSASSITFTSIPQTYTDLVLVINAATNTGTGTLIWQVGNGTIDTGANYSHTNLYGTGSAAGSTIQANTSTPYLNYFAEVNTTANANVTEVHFQNYSNTTTYKTILSRANNAASGVSAVVGLWRSTAAINQILLKLTSNSFAAGSTFSIYGIKAA